jgi:AcrR family transcriptional regulator
MSSIRHSSSQRQPSPAPGPDRRQRRSAEIRERLFRAALEQFAIKGFAETTVEDITNAADVGKGTFFNYFPSKEHILVAFSDMQIARLEDAVRTGRQSRQPMPEFLKALSVKMTAEPGRSPEVMRALLQANLSSTIRDAVRENSLRGHALLTQLMELGQLRGEFRRDIPASDLGHVFRQVVLGTVLIWSVFGDSSLPERISTALNILWKGVESREPVTATFQQS